MRIYNVLEDVRREHAFVPIITPPSESPDLKPRVDWVRFHETRQAPNLLPELGLRAHNHLPGTLVKSMALCKTGSRAAAPHRVSSKA